MDACIPNKYSFTLMDYHVKSKHYFSFSNIYNLLNFF